jgi:hypothetical protein
VFPLQASMTEEDRDPIIRIDAKRQALDALDQARRGAETNAGTDGDRSGHGPETPKNGMGIPLLVALTEGLTSQSRHSLTLAGSPARR